MHAALSSALRDIGIPSILTEANEPKLSEACFANPVASDVMENGRKIAGAAQRKTRGGLLHQGSIQRENLNEKFRSIFGKFLAKSLIVNSIGIDVMRAAKNWPRPNTGQPNGCDVVKYCNWRRPQCRPLAVWDGTAPVPPNFRGPATNSGDDNNPDFVTKARGQRFSGLALAALTLKTGLLF